MFLNEMSQTRAKGMEDVVGALRKLNRYLIETESSLLPYVGLLMAPRARERKIYPCMPQEVLDAIIMSIDLCTAIGKRDYAIVQGHKRFSGHFVEIGVELWAEAWPHSIKKTFCPLSVPGHSAKSDIARG